MLVKSADTYHFTNENWKKLNIDILSHFKTSVINSIHANIINIFWEIIFCKPKKISNKEALFYIFTNL